MTNYLIVLFFILSLMNAGSDPYPGTGTSYRLSVRENTFSDGPADTMVIDQTRSVVHWKGTKMRGMGKHEGDLRLSAGHLVFQGEHLTGGRFTADMTTIGVTDIPEHEPVPRKRLNDHLKSEDFFDVERFPEAVFEITFVEPIEDDRYEITGTLTMKGATHHISFPAERQGREYNATFSLDRFRWNVAYEGNWVDRTFVDREIELRIELVVGK